MNFSSILPVFLAFPFFKNQVPLAANPSLNIPGYGQFVGTVITETLTAKPLPAAVDAWLGINYASQPIGEDRFSPVRFPEAFDGIRDASKYGPACIQDPAPFPYDQDEAWLSMNVFRSRNIPLDEKLPVLVWIHGGAFVEGSARSFDGASFVANSHKPLEVVTFNYRLNSLGFLPTPVFERLGLLNLGLLDQEQLLKFVHEHISSFGGDPTRVTIGGRSAGAHSVAFHLFHNYEKVAGASPLFAQAILQSGSATARAFPDAAYPLYQKQFARYLDLTGCNHTSDGEDDAILACLRAAPISAIQHASTTLYRESEYHITWPFQPTRGDPLLEQAGSTSGCLHQFYHIPVITSTVTDEAKLFSPGDINDNASFLAFMRTLIPGLTSHDLADLERLYPDPTTHPDSPYAKSPNTTQYNRISAARSDYMYVCPGQETGVRLSSAGVAPIYKLHFNVNNSFPAWQGIPHTADTKYTWAEPGGGRRGVQYPAVGKLLHGYLADFVVYGDPNAGEREDVPVWPRYVDDAEKGVTGVQLRMEAGGNSKVERDGVRRVQCEWWRDEERAARLEK